MTPTSYQLYSSRKFGPLPDTLAMVAGLGYGEVEGYAGLFADADIGALAAELDGHGLKMSSAHFGLNLLESDPKRVIEVARRLGIVSVFVPAVPPEQRTQSAAGWRELGHRLVEAGKPLSDAGLIFGWHNHDFEFAHLGGAEKPLDLILRGNDLALELDVAWVVRGGEDPAVWIDRYADRIRAVHVKDIAPAGEAEDEDGWADSGHGTIDWNGLFRRLKGLNIKHWVMEHDNPSDDARFARRAIETARRLSGAPA